MVPDTSELPPPKKEIWKDKETNLWNLSIEFLVPLTKERVFKIISDPDLSTRVFSNFKGYSDMEVLDEDKQKDFTRFEMDRHQWYRVLWFKGSVATRLLYENYPKEGRQYFKLMRPGFMRVFDGRWQVEDADCNGGQCARVKLDQLFQLGIRIPGSDILIKRLVPGTTEQMMNDLIREAQSENEDSKASGSSE
ncbi:hypothetical protein KFL_001890040 [Klebsormidium nitens]|uniref:Coenzyme Q-binding protein COQ10 START domain-containing protein n=1 Tax=Klebsormidium nitens TaxID=105231 RepID=A0A1Y1I0H6_KLENI|nr:hypothetical protein KFL_001890040 [Klebsormidium nitens]|eukprot:GAQ84440.1 hypothetical protein KFL_001890040 [Klebsormidium nitens]